LNRFVHKSRAQIRSASIAMWDGLTYFSPSYGLF